MAGKYLTLQDRKTIAKMYREEARVLDIAIKIGCHPATIYEELRRGDTGKLDERQRPEYDPKLAQGRVQEAISNLLSLPLLRPRTRRRSWPITRTRS